MSAFPSSVTLYAEWPPPKEEPTRVCERCARVVIMHWHDWSRLVRVGRGVCRCGRVHSSAAARVEGTPIAQLYVAAAEAAQQRYPW